jgi:phytoene synthase
MGPRRAIQALYAFSADIASIPERAREPAAGAIRLQWWVDALEGRGRGAVRQNPLAAALLDAVAAYGLPAGALIRLLNARRFDIYQDPMPDLETFEGYAGETVSTPYQLAAMILNGGAEIEPGDAAGHLGVAHALVGHLRAFGFNASRGRIFLPWSLLAASGVTEGEVLSGTDSEGLRAALGQVAELAWEHLGKAGAATAALPRPLRPAMAPLALLPAQLALAERGPPFAHPTDIADWRKIAMLGWWSFRRA